MKIAVGITGASGAIYAQLLLSKLNELQNQISEVSIVFSPTAKGVWELELQQKPQLYEFKEYDSNDFYAPFASGSAQYDALIICPCSMGTMGRIAHGVSDSLLTRSADVMLKERKKLILVTREMPYNLIHIKNMELITLAGGIICPASPSFYSNPQSIEEACNTVINRVIDLIGLQSNSYKWGE